MEAGGSGIQGHLPQATDSAWASLRPDVSKKDEPTTTITTNRTMLGMGEKREKDGREKERGVLCCDDWGCSVLGLPPMEQFISWEKHLEVAHGGLSHGALGTL